MAGFVATAEFATCEFGGVAIVDKVSSDSLLAVLVEGAGSVAVNVEPSDSLAITVERLPFRAPGIDERALLVLHCDGSDGATSFPDSSLYGRTVTAFGTSQVDTASKKFGTGSLYNNSVAQDSLLVSGDWHIWGGDATIDLWLSLNSVTSNFTLVLAAIGTVPDNWIFGLILSSGQYRLFLTLDNGSEEVGSYHANISSPSLDTFVHYAVERHGDNFNFYVDGTKQTTVVGTNDLESIAAPEGTDLVLLASFPVELHADEIRISRTAHYEGQSFTPPAIPYDDINTGIQATAASDDMLPVILGEAPELTVPWLRADQLLALIAEDAAVATNVDVLDTLTLILEELRKLSAPAPKIRVIVVAPDGPEFPRQVVVDPEGRKVAISAAAPAKTVGAPSRTIIVGRQSRTIVVPPDDREVN